LRLPHHLRLVLICLILSPPLALQLWLSPPPKKGSSKAKKPAKGTAVTSGIAAPSAIAAAAISVAAASSTANANHS
jgi:hypothetical protein